MEDDQPVRSSSPPLPSRGSYNIDFDALDDSFNPFQTKQDTKISPELTRKNLSTSNSIEAAQESLPTEEGSNRSIPKAKGEGETPKKRKSKSPSSKRSSASQENETVQGATASDSQATGTAGSDAPETIAEKPKTKKVMKKPKSRPASKDLEAQIAGEKPKSNDGAETSAKPPTSSEDIKPQPNAASCNTDSTQDTPTTAQPQVSQPPPPAASKESVLQPEQAAPVPEKPFAPVEKTPAPVERMSAPVEKTPAPVEKTSAPVEKTPASVEKTPPPVEKTPPPSEKKREHTVHEGEGRLESQSENTPPPVAQLLSEEGAQSSPKKDRSSGRTKKTKSKVKKHHSSSPRSSTTEGADETAGRRRSEEPDVDPAAHRDKESKRSSKSFSQGDGVGLHDCAADSDLQKTKHPAARVLEQQLRDDSHPQSLAQGVLPTDSEDDFYDAFDSPPAMNGALMEEMQNYSDINDSCMLFQAPDGLAGDLSWSQEESALMDEGAGEAAFAEDLTIGDSNMADSQTTESVVKLVQEKNSQGQVLKYSQSDWNKLRQELELDFQAQVLAKEREWSAKLADRDTRLSTLDDTNRKLRQTNEDMRAVMVEFEKTIGQLHSEKEKTTNASQQSLQDLMKERDQALEDLQSVETAFSDLHRRYEKTKGVVDGFKQNEEMLKKCVQDLQNKLKKSEQKVQVLKVQAEEKLEKATEEIEQIQKSSASDVAKLEAALRKAELQVQSMESSLEQKIRENKELAAICDELIAKVQ